MSLNLIKSLGSGGKRRFRFGERFRFEERTKILDLGLNFDEEIKGDISFGFGSIF